MEIKNSNDLNIWYEKMHDNSLGSHQKMIIFNIPWKIPKLTLKNIRKYTPLKTTAPDSALDLNESYTIYFCNPAQRTYTSDEVLTFSLRTLLTDVKLMGMIKDLLEASKGPFPPVELAGMLSQLNLLCALCSARAKIDIHYDNEKQCYNIFLKPETNNATNEKEPQLISHNLQSEIPWMLALAPNLNFSALSEELKAELYMVTLNHLQLEFDQLCREELDKNKQSKKKIVPEPIIVLFTLIEDSAHKLVPPQTFFDNVSKKYGDLNPPLTPKGTVLTKHALFCSALYAETNATASTLALDEPTAASSLQQLNLTY